MARKHPRRRRHDALAPTPERCRQGIVELGGTIADDEGIISRPYITVDTLTALERRGTITRDMHRAGEEFREQFRAARIDRLRAANLEWSPSGGGDSLPSWKTIEANDNVDRSLKLLGGRFSPGGSCVLNIIGYEKTLKEWALEGGWRNQRIMQESASGMLVAALGILAAAQS